MAPRHESDAAAAGAVAMIGFMGSGKSAVGRRAAKRLGVPFIDSDKRIEERCGSIAKIFAEGGEESFRRIEGEVVLEALDEALLAPCVLALGGGAVVNVDVRVALRDLNAVVWLTAAPEALWKRVARHGAPARPLAQDEAAFIALLAERTPLYAEVATETVINDGSRPLATVVDDVVRLATRTARASDGGAG